MSTGACAGGKVELSDGSVVDYDWLVLSLGSESSTLGVPGVKEHAVLFNTIGDALQVPFAPHIKSGFWGNIMCLSFGE